MNSFLSAGDAKIDQVISDVQDAWYDRIRAIGLKEPKTEADWEKLWSYERGRLIDFLKEMVPDDSKPFSKFGSYADMAEGYISYAGRNYRDDPRWGTEFSGREIGDTLRALWDDIKQRDWDRDVDPDF